MRRMKSVCSGTRTSRPSCSARPIRRPNKVKSASDAADWRYAGNSRPDMNGDRFEGDDGEEEDEAAPFPSKRLPVSSLSAASSSASASAGSSACHMLCRRFSSSCATRQKNSQVGPNPLPGSPSKVTSSVSGHIARASKTRRPSARMLSRRTIALILPFRVVAAAAVALLLLPPPPAPPGESRPSHSPPTTLRAAMFPFGIIDRLAAMICRKTARRSASGNSDG